MEVEGTFPRDLESRGVMDERILPNYPYRDDGMLSYNAVKEYVTDVLKIYYGKFLKVSLHAEKKFWHTK